MDVCSTCRAVVDPGVSNVKYLPKWRDLGKWEKVGTVLGGALGVSLALAACIRTWGDLSILGRWSAWICDFFFVRKTSR